MGGSVFQIFNILKVVTQNRLSEFPQKPIFTHSQTCVLFCYQAMKCAVALFWVICHKRGRMRRTMSWTENLLGAWVEVESARSTQRAASDACPRQTNLSCPQWKLRKTFRLSTILVFIFILKDCKESNDFKIIVFQGFAKMNIGGDQVGSLQKTETMPMNSFGQLLVPNWSNANK